MAPRSELLLRPPNRADWARGPTGPRGSRRRCCRPNPNLTLNSKKPPTHAHLPSTKKRVHPLSSVRYDAAAAADAAARRRRSGFSGRRLSPPPPPRCLVGGGWPGGGSRSSLERGRKAPPPAGVCGGVRVGGGFVGLHGPEPAASLAAARHDFWSPCSGAARQFHGGLGCRGLCRGGEGENKQVNPNIKKRTMPNDKNISEKYVKNT